MRLVIAFKTDCTPICILLVTGWETNSNAILTHGFIQTSMDKVILKLGSIDLTFYKAYSLLFLVSLLLLSAMRVKNRERYEKVRAIQFKVQIPVIILFVILVFINVDNDNLLTIFAHLTFLCIIIPNIFVAFLLAKKRNG